MADEQAFSHGVDDRRDALGVVFARVGRRTLEPVGLSTSISRSLRGKTQALACTNEQANACRGTR
jgi:hypothetical protein